MKIYDCLLNNKNNTPIGNTTLGAKIASCKKEYLWEERSSLAKDNAANNNDNHDNNNDSNVIDTVVIHYMSAALINPKRRYDTDLLLGIFCDYGVSSHYLISRRGKILRLVPEDKKAWHCGPSIMPAPDNRTGVNAFSIGIELTATEKSGFTKSQYNALCKLCADIETRRGTKLRYIGHDRIAGERAVKKGLRKDVKTDPGPLFDWDFFYAKMSEIRRKQSS